MKLLTPKFYAAVWASRFLENQAHFRTTGRTIYFFARGTLPSFRFHKTANFFSTDTAKASDHVVSPYGVIIFLEGLKVFV